MSMTPSNETRIFKAGVTGIDAIAMYQAWNQLVALLPPKHHLLISGPWADGHILINVIDQTRQPSKSIISCRSNSITEAFRVASMRLTSEEAAVAKTVYQTQPRSKGKFAKQAEPIDPFRDDELVKMLRTPEGQERFRSAFDALMGDGKPNQNTPGFTRDRDLVAYLVYKNGRVSQYELRHQYGIKNPAQAINDAEGHFHFTMETGGAMPNGDIPYRLLGAAPVIEGTMPMFSTGIEDPDEKFYVLELDLYLCAECGRHPVYRPQRIEGAYAGVCPRHGPATFTRI